MMLLIRGLPSRSCVRMMFILPATVLLVLASIHRTATLISQHLRTREWEGCFDAHNKHVHGHGLRVRTCLRTPYLSWKASRMLRSHKWKPRHASNTL